MTGTRWRKVWGDLRLRWGRTLLTALGLALGLYGVGTVGVALGILSSDMNGSYQRTLPPDITLEVDAAATLPMQALAAAPGLSQIGQRIELSGRLQTPRGRWMALALTVVDDFDQLPLARFFAQDGAWPPPTGGVLLERDARFFVPMPEGSPMRLRLPDGREVQAALSGHAYDPGRPPARMEQMLYGYTSRATLAAWNFQPQRVRLLARASEDSPAARQALAGRLQKMLEDAHITVYRSEVAALRQHPHQFQLDSIEALLIGLAAVAWAICAVLIINLVDAILVREQRAIGVLKALGARSGQIALDYLLVMAALGAVATLASLVPAALSGQAIARGIAGMLNFDLMTPGVTAPLLALVLAAGVLTPVAVAAWRITRTARRPVREALSRAPIHQQAGDGGWLHRLGAGLPMVPRVAWRTLLRQPRRSLLTALVLALGLSCCIGALNLRQSLLGTVQAVMQQRPYDLSVVLRHPGEAAELQRWASGFANVQAVELWSSTSARLADGSAAASGSVPLLSLPPGPLAMQPALLQGRWLDAAQPDGVVVNQKLLADRPGLQLGSRLSLQVAGRSAPVQVIGVIKEFAGGAVYASQALAEPLLEQPGHPNLMLLTLKQSTLRAQLDLATQLEAGLAGHGWQIAQSQPGRMFEAAVQGHLEPMVWLLFGIACLALGVGGLGLASSISVSIVERHRELGVFKALGAGSGVVAGLFVCEALGIAALGWLMASAVAPLLSRVLANTVGRMVLQYPFDYQPAPFVLPAALLAALLLAVLASAGPIRLGLRSTVHEALRTA